MPLPANGTTWPPTQLAAITPRLHEWDAWWSGDTRRLREVYARDTEQVRPSQRAGGVVGAVSRFWWGKPHTDWTVNRTRRMHLPVAADLCQASADLLFSDAPKITSTTKTVQERLDEYVDDGLVTVCAQAAEIGAALGSTFLRVTWDPAVSPRPFLTAIDTDAAVPEFAYGQLRAVTFWWVVRTENNRVWRHLERHELAPNGDGLILHGLYAGTTTDLGQVVPLTDDPATAGLALVVDQDSTISTNTPGLAVVHIPNQAPSRRWRNDPVGRHLGRSDLDGIEHLMDGLDETWTSWMRDIDNGKGRIIAAQSVLTDLGPGKGAGFDTDRQVFTPVNVLGREQAGLPIEVVQFQIRVAEHQQTCQEILTSILRTAGYSAQTFGEGGAVTAMTATEVDSRDQRSLLTRDRKLRAWQPALLALVRKMLTVDSVLLGGGLLPGDDVTVVFPDAVQEPPLSLAQTVAAWSTAQAASTGTKVRHLHPDWSDDQITEEVARIGDEAPAPVPDPFGAHPTDGQPGDQPAPDDGQNGPGQPGPPVG